MAASTAILTDLDGLTFNATSKAKAIAHSGPIQDLDGNKNIALRKAQELKVLLSEMKKAVDSGDSGALDVINNVLDSLD